MANKGTFTKGDKRAGRKPGVPNKVTGDLRDMILQALSEAGGVEYLVAQAHDNPGPFMALVGKIVPKDLNIKGDVLYRVLTGVPLPEALRDADSDRPTH